MVFRGRPVPIHSEKGEENSHKEEKDNNRYRPKKFLGGEKKQRTRSGLAKGKRGTFSPGPKRLFFVANKKKRGGKE